MANTKVQSEQIEDGSITADKLADGTIVAAELADNAVETAAINADAVTGAKIADNAIDSEHYTDGSIDTDHIADSQITVGKMAANSVDSDQYVDGSIDTVHIADLQVTTAKIANGNISTAKIADNAVTSAKIDTNIDIAGTFDVTGATTLDSTLAVAGDLTASSDIIIDNSSGDPFLKLKTSAQEYVIRIDQSDSEKFQIRDVTDSATRITLDGSGNVGIGTDNPTKPLHVAGSGSTVAIAIDNTGTGGDTWRIWSTNDAASDGGGKLGFYNEDTTTRAMTLDSSGNVGIGTTSPSVKLVVAGSLSEGGGVINLENTATSVNGQAWGSLNFISNDSSTGASGTRASIIGTSTSFNGDGNLTFSTAPASGTNTERMRIDSSGNVKIGDAATDITSKLTVSGNASSDVATFMYDGAAGTYFDIDCGAANNTVTLRADARSGSFPPLAFTTGGSERMVIDSTGRITAPYQPAFLALPASTQSNIAVNTTVNIVFGDEMMDIGSNFASNTFTAPVTGKYQLNVNVRLDNVDTAALYYHINLVTSNRTYYSIIDPNFSADLSYHTIQMSVLADMDANDTAKLDIYQNGGSAQTDIHGSTWSNFSGYLVA